MKILLPISIFVTQVLEMKSDPQFIRFFSTDNNVFDDEKNDKIDFRQVYLRAALNNTRYICITSRWLR